MAADVPAPSPPAERAGASVRAGWIDAVLAVVFLGLLALTLAAFGGPRASRFRGGPADTAEFQLKNLADAIATFVTDRGAVPATIEDLTLQKTLVPYVDEIPLDPWGHAYQYEVVDAARGRFQMRSAGPDGRFETDDDLAWPSRAGVR